MQVAHNITTTNNGGVALKSTNNIIVDYFMLFMRDLDIQTSHDYLEKCWKEDPKKTVAIIFNGRDRDKGKKEKKVANDAMSWLRKKKFTTYINNIKKYIEKYGCWKDLNYIGYKLKSSDQKYELGLFVLNGYLAKMISTIKRDIMQKKLHQLSMGAKIQIKWKNIERSIWYL